MCGLVSSTGCPALKLETLPGVAFHLHGFVIAFVTLCDWQRVAEMQQLADMAKYCRFYFWFLPKGSVKEAMMAKSRTSSSASFRNVGSYLLLLVTSHTAFN